MSARKPPTPTAPPPPERPEGFVADAPPTFDGDETAWAAELSRRADAENPELAKARARLAALARVPRPPKKPS